MQAPTDRRERPGRTADYRSCLPAVPLATRTNYATTHATGHASRCRHEARKATLPTADAMLGVKT